MTVLLAGHLCADLTPALPGDPLVEPGRLAAVGPLRVSLGGSVANTGRVLGALGIPIRAAAASGDDALGGLVRELLASEGFDTSEVRTIAGMGTSYSIVIQPPALDRTFWHHSGANDAFVPDDVSLDGVELLHVGYPSLLAALAADDGAALRRLFARARERGITTSLDLAVVDPGSDAATTDWLAFLTAVLPLTDLFTPSIDDLSSSLGGDATPAERVDSALALGAGAVVVTAGDRGLAFGGADATRMRAGGRALASVADSWGGIRLTAPTTPVDRVVSTNGAGDASTAGFIAATLAGLAPADSLELAGRCAAAVVADRPFPSPIRH
jgi:sugar/nucleoside kinase (ribokinase family)